MQIPSFRQFERVVRAATLRFLGHDWETVAWAVRSRPESVRRWPAKYPKFWACGVKQGRAERERLILQEVELTLRELLRSRKRKNRLEAARLILCRPDETAELFSETARLEAERVMEREGFLVLRKRNARKGPSVDEWGGRNRAR